MATIESLDLADLQNNPSDIAEALEDVLETTSGNIGSLKTAAQDNADDIAALKTSAQDDHDEIEGLLGALNVNHVHYTTGLGSDWSSTSHSSATTDEEGVRVYQTGKIYLVHLCITGTMGTGAFNDNLIYDFDSEDFDLPGGTLHLGLSQYQVGIHEDWSYSVYLTSSGELKCTGLNGSGSMMLFDSFFAIDFH